jgi:small neutral amino acid transporter SnatA (MarC family)
MTLQPSAPNTERERFWINAAWFIAAIVVLSYLFGQLVLRLG